MKKFIVLVAVCLYAAVAFAVDAPPDGLKATNFGKKDVVTVNHSTHTAQTCVSCHHNEADGNYKCGDCHGAEEANGAPSFKDAAHKKDVGTCWKCHNKKSPDVVQAFKCKDCHKG